MRVRRLVVAISALTIALFIPAGAGNGDTGTPGTPGDGEVTNGGPP